MVLRPRNAAFAVLLLPFTLFLACGEELGAAPGADASAVDAASDTFAPALDSGGVDADAGPRPPCGDGEKKNAEECDDGNASSGDGCSATCTVESGWVCPEAEACKAIRCGDGLRAGAESCDDGNHDFGDGCTPSCEIEPACTAGICASRCGDGIVVPGDVTEECDDGNLVANDGCSPACKLEAAFTCVIGGGAAFDVPLVVRDFRGKGQPTGGTYPSTVHPDFEQKNGIELGIVAESLGADGKPVYAKEGVPSSTTSGKLPFDQWFRDVANVNVTELRSLTMVGQQNGSYRFAAPAFFPIDGAGWISLGKENPIADAVGDLHNFGFTSEARFWFAYGGTEVLTFTGDDDVFVYVNRKLALDLGGVHSAMSGSVTLSTHVAKLGLEVGKVYEVAIFQSERRSTGSSYSLVLSSFTRPRSVCVPKP